MHDAVTRDKAKATLDFLGDGMADRIDSYGISSDVEKAHFLTYGPRLLNPHNKVEDWRWEPQDDIKTHPKKAPPASK